MKHTDTAATLAAIDATLRLTERALWETPEFQEWEAGQTTRTITYCLTDLDEQDRVEYSLHEPGPEHWTNHTWNIPAETVHTAPMVDLAADHNPRSGCCTFDYGDRWAGASRIAADDYPDPEHTTLGPLMLGPEPGVRPDVLTALVPGCRYRDAEGATWERTDGGMQLITDTDGKDYSAHMGGHLRLPEEASDVIAFAPYTPA